MATDINSVVLVGRLTRTVGDDERSFGFTNSGTARANLSVAVNRSIKKGNEWVDETSYFDVVLWGKQAEALKPYLVKGQQISVQGTLKQERWESNGQKASKVVINADNVQLLGGKKEGGTNGNASATKSAPVEVPPQEDFPEDVPF